MFSSALRAAVTIHRNRIWSLDRMVFKKIGGAATRAGATRIRFRNPLAYRSRPIRVGGVSMIRLLGNWPSEMFRSLIAKLHLGQADVKQKKEKIADEILFLVAEF